MAGAGYKLFNTGDVLTAAQVNTYLMEQTVMVFANAAARTTALSGVVSEGMISYLKDTNAVEVYDGSNWVSSDDPNAIQNTIVDAKGDLIAATANDTPARLPVGTKNQSLIVDSTTSTGLKWGNTPALGGMVALNPGGTALTGAATVRVTGLSALSRLTILAHLGSSANASAYIFLRFNNDSTANYGYAGLYIAAGTVNSAYAISSTSIPLARQGNNAADTWGAICNVYGSFDTGMYQLDLGSTAGGAGTTEAYSWASGFYNGGQAISSVDIISNSGNLDAGHLYLFGA
jgi:tRNA-binding EMAP/Myf-like protein